jgi:hypothetical protein
MKQARLYLDTIGFSGFNTAMLAVECGLPVVTREGRFMRGRLASGHSKAYGAGGARGGYGGWLRRFGSALGTGRWVLHGTQATH